MLSRDVEKGEMSSSLTNDTVAVDESSIAVVDNHWSSIPVTLMPSQNVGLSSLIFSVPARTIAFFRDLWTTYCREQPEGGAFAGNQPLTPASAKNFIPNTSFLLRVLIAVRLVPFMLTGEGGYV